MEEFRRRLRGCIQKLSLSIVMKEVQVFSRLLYRSKSQHRRDKSYQMLVRVSSGRGSVRSILNYTLLILCVGIQGPEALSYCSPPQSIEGTIEAMVTVTCLVEYNKKQGTRLAVCLQMRSNAYLFCLL